MSVFNTTLGKVELKALKAALCNMSIILGKCLTPSSKYAWSFEAEGQNRTKYCIKTLASLDDEGNAKVICPSDLQKMASEIGTFEGTVQRRIPVTETTIARIERSGSWTSPAIEQSIYWYAQSWIEGDELKERLNPSDNFEGISEIDEWCDWARRLMNLVARLHHYGVAHGDLWPRNVKVTQNGHLALIDLADCMDVAKKYGQLGAEKGNLGIGQKEHWQAPEESGGKRHAWFQSDIWRMGRILLWFAIGKNVDATGLFPSFSRTTGNEREALKNELQSALAQYNKIILKQAPWILDVLLLCLHKEVSDRAGSVGEVLSLMTSFQRAAKSGTVHIHANVLMKQCDKIKTHLIISKRNKRKKSAFADNPVFCNMVNLELERLERRISDTNETNIYQVTGNRDECLHHLLDFLSFLNKGDKYIAATIPKFWNPHGVGADGRFTRMSLTLALAGVQLKRIFLVSNKSSEEEILKETAIIKHQEILAELQDKVLITNLPFLNQDGCYFGYTPIDDKALTDFKNFGFDVGLAIQGKTTTSIYCRPTKDHLTQITFKPENDNIIFNKMQEQFKNSRELCKSSKCYTDEYTL